MEQYDHSEGDDFREYEAELKAMAPEDFVAHLVALQQKRVTGETSSDAEAADILQAMHFEELFHSGYHDDRDARFAFCRDVIPNVERTSQLNLKLINTMRKMVLENADDPLFTTQCNCMIMDYHYREQIDCWDDCQLENIAVWDKLNEHPEIQLMSCSFVLSDETTRDGLPEGVYDQFIDRWIDRLEYLTKPVEKKHPQTGQTVWQPLSKPISLINMCRVVLRNDLATIPDDVMDLVSVTMENSILREAKDAHTLEDADYKAYLEVQDERKKDGMKRQKYKGRPDYTSYHHGMVWEMTRWAADEVQNATLWHGYWAQSTLINFANVSPTMASAISLEISAMTNKDSSWSFLIMDAINNSNDTMVLNRRKNQRKASPDSESAKDMAKKIADMREGITMLTKLPRGPHNEASALAVAAELIAINHTTKLKAIEESLAGENPQALTETLTPEELALLSAQYNEKLEQMKHAESKNVTDYYQTFLKEVATPILLQDARRAESRNLVFCKARLNEKILMHADPESTLGRFAAQQRAMLNLCLLAADPNVQLECEAFDDEEKAEFKKFPQTPLLIHNATHRELQFTRHFDLN